MTRERQSTKKEETRRLILDTARSIVTKEGMAKLSIRKITRLLDYSPGIVYHYFKDKDEIMETLLEEGYQNIIKSLMTPSIHKEDPEEEVRVGFSHYIQTVLEYGDEYKAFVLSERPNILKHTRILHQGISESRASMKQLCGSLSRGVEKGIFRPCDVELTAQALWVAVNGLTLRLIIEGVDKEQQDRLIERQLDILIKGIRA